MKPIIIFTVTNDLVYDRRMIRIGESLATEGYNILLVGRELKDSKPFQNDFIRHKRFRLWFNKGKLFYLEYNIRLFLWLLFQNFDVVCGIDLDTILPCYFATLLRHKRSQEGKLACVYDAHELFTEVPEVVRRPAIHRIWLSVEKWIVPRVPYTYTVSQSIVEEFARRYKVRFELIRNMPKKAVQIHKPIRKGKPVILYQGNLNEGRGLETAIGAMHYIHDAELWIAGDGDLGAILRGRAKEEKLEHKVKFLGYVQPKDLDNITRQATIGLHVLEDKGLSYRFSLANKFLDYIQAGVPQVCTNLIEHQRINQAHEVAILIEKPDIGLLVGAINKLLHDPSFYEKLRGNCQNAAEIYNWDIEQQRLRTFYARICNKAVSKVIGKLF